jgi:hypothetical protein
LRVEISALKKAAQFTSNAIYQPFN